MLTALHFVAAGDGHRPLLMCNLLIDRGADVNAPDYVSVCSLQDQGTTNLSELLKCQSSVKVSLYMNSRPILKVVSESVHKIRPVKSLL